MIGTTLGPYRIDRELGSGGMGKVYGAVVEGRCPGLAVGTRVALKVVHPHLLETPGFFKRFLREAEIGKSVVHENVVRTFDADELVLRGEPHHFLVMEYVEGQTLRGLLHELDRVPEELCRHIGREVSKGLAAIHAAGVVHRDMKPENVLITKEHVVKVMDLGVARLNGEALRLSQTGAFVGSIPYAAPECFREGGRHVDGRADLHALGLVLYELSCGTNPYLADDAPQILEKILHEEPRRLGDANPQLSAFYEEVVHCLLAKKREDRFADATALLGVLEEGEESGWWKSRSKAIRAVTERPLRRIRIPRETAVHGREGEIGRLRALYEKAKAGEGQVVLIEGEAGIGKSRLMDEVIGGLQRDGEDLNFLYGSYPPGGAATASGAFSTAYREQFGEGGCTGYLPQSPILGPAFDALLRGESAPTGVEPLTKDSLQTCFVQATRALAAERTTVVLVDDLHFAPEEGRSLFASLALAVPGHRILLVGTTRPGVPETWVAGLTRLEQTSQLPLVRLGPKELIRLLEDAFHSQALASSLGAQIALKSDGNPFFVFEIIRGLREGQFITRRDDGTWVTTRVIADIQIPSSVLDLVNARVADLSEDERNLLDVASCWGFEFDPLLVGAVFGVAHIPLLRVLGQIERRHRLVRASGRTYVFDHHQVQEALYGSLSELLREEYHAALASALEARAKSADKDPTTLDGALCAELCEHFLKGAQGERALRYLGAALTHLEEGYLNDAVIRLAERALAVPGLLVGIERAKTLLLLCGPLDRLGRRARQEEAAREAERLASEAADDDVRGRAAGALGEVFLVTSRYPEAESSHRRSQEIARARGDRKAEDRATRSLGNVFSALGRYGEAREHYERGLALAREVGDRQGEAGATINLGNVFRIGGRFAEAREHLERGIAICREIGHRLFEANATINLGLVFHFEGRPTEAQEHLERGLAIFGEIGNRQGEASATSGLGNVLVSEGRLGEAREHYERGLAIFGEIGNRQGEAIAAIDLSGITFSEGRLAEAREHAERGIAICREIGDRLGEANAIENLGNVSLAQGRLGQAREHYERGIAILREIGHRVGEGHAIQSLVVLADEEGDASAALRFADEALALQRRIVGGEGVGDALLALGDLRRRSGDPDGARAALTEGLSLVREQKRAPEVALALAMLACVPGGDAGAAVAALAEAGEGEYSQLTRWLLWQATHDRAHLAEAKRLLDDLLAKNSDSRASMLVNVRLNRDIAAAAKEQGL